jgi:hypothetical protein
MTTLQEFRCEICGRITPEPLVCNSVQRFRRVAGDLVAVQGVGGLGHIAIQFGNKLGYKAADPRSVGGHPKSIRHVSDPNLRGTIKELAQLDGAFVVSHDGFVLSACRYLDVLASNVELPLGLGSRHIAAANMSAVTNDVGVVVSESAVVRLFCHGKLVGEIIPELWMIDRTVQLRGPVKKETIGELTVFTPSTRPSTTAQ